MREKIVEIIREAGVGLVEKTNTIRTTCPSCGRDDKFSILKKNGSCVCYHAKCEFGKRWFEEWISLTLNVTVKEARKMLYSEEIDPDRLASTDRLNFEVAQEQAEETLNEITYPAFHMSSITDPDSADGLRYLEGRGITKDQAVKYEICFSKLERRVYFPIKMGGRFYGYQGRHIDKVDDSMKMRNNDGFRRELLVMFADNLEDSDFAIVAEGPVDALKFDSVGANVATMGKIVSDKQLAVIYSYGISKLYLALDDDAAYEMNQIVSKTHLEAYRVTVPESVVQRCRAVGKKADFGECTQEEAKLAFEAAKPINPNSIMLYVPQG